MLTTYRQLDPFIAAMRRDIRDYQQRRAEPKAAARRSAAELAGEMGVALDAWQRRVLASKHRRRICLVTRQGGKGTVGSLTAVEKMVNDPGSKIVILAPTEDQSKRLLARIKEAYARLGTAPRIIADVGTEFRLLNGSRVLAMPGSERSVRGIDAVDLLIVDEAALVQDELYAAVRPMLATTNGEELDLSTPHGKRGWFYRAYELADAAAPPPHMFRIKVTAPEIPRISAEFLANERSELGDFVYRQEYLCAFVDDETQLYPTDLVMAALSPGASGFGLPVLGPS